PTFPSPVGRGLDPAVQIYLAHNFPACRDIPRAAYTPPLHATGSCAANTKTTPAKLRRGGVKTPPYGFTEIANKIVNTNSRQVVGAACRPPVQFDLAVNARCCVPVPARLRGRAVSRAAYTPPLHATGPCAANTKTTPAKLYGMCEHNRKYQFPSGRRGGLQAARAILSCRERAVLRPRSRPPSRAGRFPGRRTRRPYMQRGLVRQTPKPRLPNCAPG